MELSRHPSALRGIHPQPIPSPAKNLRPVDRFSGQFSGLSQPAATPATSSRRSFLTSCLRGLAGVVLAQPLVANVLKAEEGAPECFPMEEDKDLARKRMLESAHQVMDPHDQALDMHWPDNTRVYAATTQEAPAYTEKGAGAFTTRFLRPVSYQKAGTVRSKHALQKIKDLDGLLRSLNDGWVDSRGRPQVPVLPVEASGKTGWTTADNGKVKRYVLLISGEGDIAESAIPELSYWETLLAPFESISEGELVTRLRDEGEEDLADMLQYKINQEKSFQADIRQMRRGLAKLFNLSRAMVSGKIPEGDTCFACLDKPTPKQLKQFLKKWLGPHQDKNAEVLIYYSGHGSLENDGIEGSENKDPARKALPQGAEKGKLWITNHTPIHENELKRYFQKYLKGYRNVALVVDACHSGALVAGLFPESGKTAIA